MWFVRVVCWRFCSIVDILVEGGHHSCFFVV